MINHKFDPDKFFQKILFRIDYWINEGSGWMLNQLILNTLMFELLLSGSSCILLPFELKNSEKDYFFPSNECFLWCHIKHINLVKIHPERITQNDKEMIYDLDYKGIEFPV